MGDSRLNDKRCVGMCVCVCVLQRFVLCVESASASATCEWSFVETTWDRVPLCQV